MSFLYLYLSTMLVLTSRPSIRINHYKQNIMGYFFNVSENQVTELTGFVIEKLEFLNISVWDNCWNCCKELNKLGAL